MTLVHDFSINPLINERTELRSLTNKNAVNISVHRPGVFGYETSKVATREKFLESQRRDKADASKDLL